MTQMFRWCRPLIVSMVVVAASVAQPSLTLKYTLRDGLHRPIRIAAQSSGTIAIGDYHRKTIHFFDRSGRPLSRISVPAAPLSIAFAGDGHLYVGVLHDVLKVTMEGTIVDRFSSHGTTLGSPVDIVVGTSDQVIVVDRETHRVCVFTSAGNLQFSFGTYGTANGQLRMPSGVAFDRTAGEIIVADAGNSRVQVFSAQGEFRRSFGQHIQQNDSTWNFIGAFAQMQGVAVDANQRIYVSDSGLDHVQVFDRQENHLGFLGRDGHAATRFRVPMGAAIVDSFLYVTSMAGSEVRAYVIGDIITTVKEPEIPLTYGLEQNYPNPFNPATNIRFSLPSPAAVTLKIYDLTGREVRTLVDEDYPAGFHAVNWNGRNHAGIPVASGIFFYRLDVAGKFSQTNKMIFLK